MNKRTTIFIVEQDCSLLVMLMLWLDQFTDFEVFAATRPNDFMHQLKETQPDVVLLGSEFGRQEGIFSLREIKSLNEAPAVLMFYNADSIAHDSMLAHETDELIGTRTALTEICDVVRKTANKRRVALSAANMPMTKAG